MKEFTALLGVSLLAVGSFTGALFSLTTCHSLVVLLDVFARKSYHGSGVVVFFVDVVVHLFPFVGLVCNARRLLNDSRLHTPSWLSNREGKARACAHRNDLFVFNSVQVGGGAARSIVANSDLTVLVRTNNCDVLVFIHNYDEGAADLDVTSFHSVSKSQLFGFLVLAIKACAPNEQLSCVSDRCRRVPGGDHTDSSLSNVAIVTDADWHVLGLVGVISHLAKVVRARGPDLAGVFSEEQSVELAARNLFHFETIHLRDYSRSKHAILHVGPKSELALVRITAGVDFLGRCDEE